MKRRRADWTLSQWVILVELALGVCAMFTLLGLLVVSDIPSAPSLPLARLPPPTTAPLPSPPVTAAQPSPPPLPSIQDITTEPAAPPATASPAATAAVPSPDTPMPQPVPTETLSPTDTPAPQPTSTPLWPTPVSAAWVAGTPSDRASPTLDDFWSGHAVWLLETFDAGLPMGESDTLIGPDGQLWSYLHASWDSRGVLDQWGERVPFPGCVTLWQSSDRGRRFTMFVPRCLIACRRYPCGAIADDIDQQQYPRVARADDGTFVMVYEWRAQIYLRTSADGLNWSASRYVRYTGVWNTTHAPCRAFEMIWPHPLVPPESEYDCLAGGPPGLIVEGDRLYVFVGMGKNPGHMGCLTGPLALGVSGLEPCRANPLFQGATSYGRLDDYGPGANPYFDFRTVSSADVLRVGDRYYVTYEGVRGPLPGAVGDSQFNLGFARSLGPWIDGPWEKYPGNPVLMDVPGNVGIGHADLIVLDGVTYLYTATSEKTRGRYMLEWKP